MLSNPNGISTRNLAWNVAGERVTDESMTAHDALKRAGMLDWNVRKVELTTAGKGKDKGLTVPDKFATVRDDEEGPVVLGTVGDRYNTWQNEEAVDLLDAIVGEGGANIEAAGYFGRGQRVFGVLRLPESVTIGGVDPMEQYLGFATSHDGTSSLTMWTTYDRLACTNMINSSIAGAPSKWRLRHTRSIKGKVEEARRSLELGFNWGDAAKEAFEKLLSTPFSQKEFEAFVDQLAPESESEHEGWIKRQQEKRDALFDLFNEAETNAIGRGTKWAAYNAATEYADWVLPVKGGNVEKKLAQRQLDSTSLDAFKQRAFDLLAVR